MLGAILKYIRGLLFIGEHYNSWILWFLLSSIYTLIFVYILYKNKVNNKKMLMLGSIISLFGIIITELVNYNGYLPSFVYNFSNIIKITILNGRIFTGFIYIPIGIFLSSRKYNSNVIILLLFFVSYLLRFILYNFYILEQILTILSSLLMFILISNIKLRSNNVYYSLRRLSKINYYCHLLIWTIISFFLTNKYSFQAFVLTLLGCLILFLINVIITNKRKNTKQ